MIIIASPDLHLGAASHRSIYQFERSLVLLSREPNYGDVAIQLQE